MQKQFQGNKTYSLVGSYKGAGGLGLWRCRQTGKVERLPIAKTRFIPKLGERVEYLSTAAKKWFWRT